MDSVMWRCEVCSTSNHSSRDTCLACSTLQTIAPWTCPTCLVVNKTAACQFCQPAPLTVPAVTMETSSAVTMATTVEEIPWLCGMCDYENTPKRLLCFECSGHRERVEVRNRRAEIRMGGGNSSLQRTFSTGREQVGSYQGNNSTTRDPRLDPVEHYPSYRAPARRQEQHPANRVIIRYPGGKVEDQTFDWNCGNCGNRNFASRKECNKCKTPKAMCFVEQNAQSTTSSRRYGDRDQTSWSGDWTPAGSGEIQPHPERAARDRSAEGTRMEKGTRVERPEDRSKDWLCTSCQNRNWAKRNNCNKCNEPRDSVEDKSVKFDNPEEPVRMSPRRPLMSATRMPGRYEPYPSAREKTWDGTFTKPRKKWVEEDKTNDWLCGSCNINNFTRRTTCFRCHKQKADCVVKGGSEEKGGSIREDEVTVKTAE